MKILGWFLSLFFVLISISCASLMEQYSNEKVPRLQPKTNPPPLLNPYDLQKESPSTQDMDMEPSKTLTEREPTKKKILFLKLMNRTPYHNENMQKKAFEAIEEKFASLQEYEILNDKDWNGSAFLDEELKDYDYKSLFQSTRAQDITGILTGSIEDVQVSEKGDEVGFFRSRTYAVHATVRLRLFDSHTEKQLLNKVAEADVTEEYTHILGSRAPLSFEASYVNTAVYRATQNAVSDLQEKIKHLAWVGRIARIDLHRYYLNSGESSGIQIGQLLKVFGPVKPIHDRNAEVFVGMAPGEYKGLLRVVDYFGKDGAIAIMHSGGGFQEKDRVEVYTPPTERGQL